MTGMPGSTLGLRRTTHRDAAFKARVATFGLALAAVALLVTRIDTSIWSEQGHLQEEFAAVKAERFYFGVNFRVRLRQIRETWLDLYLTGNPADRNGFRREAQALEDWLHSKEKDFTTPSEQQSYQHLQAALGEFVSRLDQLMQASRPDSSRREFAAAYEQLHAASAPMLQLCEEIVRAEHDQFDVFLRRSDQTLISLQRLLLASLVLLVASVAALAVAAWRGMIAPLRAELNESRIVIERQEKLAALGTLGAGLAHEIRNPLTAIKFRLFSLMEALPPGFAENEDARTISQELKRLDHIVTDFLQFARPSDPELTPVPAMRILHEVADLMEPQLRPLGISLKIEVRQPAWIAVDTHQLKQVLINLIQNSADSIGRDGTITLRLDTAHAGFGGAGQPATVISVEDNGKGIPAKVQRRLFDPFFTTKEGGTGLGLAIAARIVEKHRGRLSYKTEVNRGTIFRIMLPHLKDHAG